MDGKGGVAVALESDLGFAEAAHAVGPPPFQRSDRQDEADRPAASMRFKANVFWSRSECARAWTKLQTEGFSTAFQTSLWIDCVCDHLLKSSRSSPFFVEVVDADTGAAALLLALLLTRRGGVRTISWLNFGVCDYAAPLIAPGINWSAAAAEDVWTTIRAALPPADVIDIEQIPLEVGGAVNPLALLAGRRMMDLKAYGVPLEPGVGAIVGRSMGSKPFRELGRRRRRLESQGEIRFVEALTESELDDIFGSMVRQRRRRFEKLGRFDLLSRPRFEAFYHQAALQSLRDGSPARVFGVSVNGEWISTAYVLVHAKVFHGIIMSMGGDEWNKYGPGLLIVTELMRWSQEQGHTYFDLTIGEMPYKKDIRPQQRDLFRIVEARTVVGSCAVGLLSIAAAVSSWLTAHPETFAAMRSFRHGLRRLLKR